MRGGCKEAGGVRRAVAGRCELRKGDAIYSPRGLLNSPSVSLKLYASASSVFSGFAALSLMHVRVCVRARVYSQNEEPSSRFGLPGRARFKKRQRAKHPFPVTDRPDTNGNWLFLSAGATGRGRAKVRVNSRGRDNGRDVSPGGRSRHEMCPEPSRAFLSESFSPPFPPPPSASSLKFVATGFPVTDGPQAGDDLRRAGESPGLIPL